MRYDEAEAKLKELGYNIEDLAENQNGVMLKLPFMWINGRTDYTVSIMGANIYPEDVESALYANNDLAKITRSFCQAIKENDKAEQQPLFMFEIEEGDVNDPKLNELFKNHILEHLIELNLDFKEAYGENPEALTPCIELYNVGEGVFKMKEGQIKQKRLLK